MTICGEIANAYNPQPSNKLQDKFPRKESGTGTAGGRGEEEKGGEMDVDMEREMEMDIH